MTEKTFTFDLGKIMDEAFRVAQNCAESFGEKFTEGFPSAEEMREHFRNKFKWHGHSDFYPYYSYPPMNIFLAKDKSMVFEVALAGFEEKDIDLQFRGDYLYFAAQAPAGADEEEGIQYFKRRLKLKSIDEQRYYVPEDKFDRDRVDARFKDGLLRITIPALTEKEEKEGIKVRIVSEKKKSATSASGSAKTGQASSGAKAAGAGSTEAGRSSATDSTNKDRGGQSDKA